VWAVYHFSAFTEAGKAIFYFNNFKKYIGFYLTLVFIDINVGCIKAENFAYALKIAISLFVNGIICL
jgi:hypothetical protein